MRIPLFLSLSCLVLRPLCNMHEKKAQMTVRTAKSWGDRTGFFPFSLKGRMKFFISFMDLSYSFCSAVGQAVLHEHVACALSQCASVKLLGWDPQLYKLLLMLADVCRFIRVQHLAPRLEKSRCLCALLLNSGCRRLSGFSRPWCY